MRPILAASDDLSYYPQDFYEPRWQRFLIRGAFLVLLLIVAYLPSLGGKLLWVGGADGPDDVLSRSARGVLHLWTHPVAAPEYRPLAATLQWLEYRTWGIHAAGYHAVSLALHAGNCLLAWAVLRRLGASGAWLAAAAFGLHPVQVQAVAWPGGQPTLLGTALFLSSLWAYLRFARIEPPPPMEADELAEVEAYRAAGHAVESAADWTAPDEWRRWVYVTALLLFLGAVLAGPSAACLPVVVLLIGWWKRGGVSRRRDVVPLLPFLIVGAAAAVLGIVCAELNAPRDVADALPSVPVLGRVLVAGRAAWFYAAKLAWPYPLVFAYPRWAVNPWAAWQYLFPLAFAGAGWAAWRWRGRVGRAAIVAVAFYALNVLPYLGLTANAWMRHSFVADHHAYRAALGLIALAVGALVSLLNRVRSDVVSKAGRLAVGAAVLTGCGALSWAQASAYDTPQTLWADVLDKDPDSPTALRQMATLRAAEGKFPVAAGHLEALLRVRPDDRDAALELGRVYEADNRLREAIEQYRQVLHADPGHVKAHQAIAGLLSRTGRRSEAMAHYRKALERSPDDPAVHLGIGLLYAADGDVDAAMREYRTAIAADAYSVPAHLNLAEALFRQRRYDEAAEELQTAARIDPGRFESFMYSGDMLFELKDYPRAEAMYRQAVRLRGDSAQAQNNLGSALFKQDRVSEAIYCFGKAVALRPDFVEARRNLDAAERRRGAGGQGGPG